MKDASTDTGRRLNLEPASMPANKDGLGIDPTEQNRNDGFSPGQTIIVHVPGLETQAALRRTPALVPLTDLGALRRRTQAVVVINARRPASASRSGAELDSNAADRRRTVNLIIRPPRTSTGRALHRRAAQPEGRERQDDPARRSRFRVYRDKLITEQKPRSRTRRARHGAAIFKTLEKAGDRAQQPLHGLGLHGRQRARASPSRALAMRDDAFARLGDTNLADRIVQGDAPDFTITRSTRTRQARRTCRAEVEGTFEVPCYLDTTGCAPGAKFTYDSPDDSCRTATRGTGRQRAVRVHDPASTSRTARPAHPARASLYGHGLLGSAGEVNGSGDIRRCAQDHNIMHLRGRLGGLRRGGPADRRSAIAQRHDEVLRAADRMQQGFVNFMYLGRADDPRRRLRHDPAFQFDAGPAAAEPVIDDVGASTTTATARAGSWAAR